MEIREPKTFGEAVKGMIYLPLLGVAMFLQYLVSEKDESTPLTFSGE